MTSGGGQSAAATLHAHSAASIDQHRSIATALMGAVPASYPARAVYGKRGTVGFCNTTTRRSRSGCLPWLAQEKPRSMRGFSTGTRNLLQRIEKRDEVRLLLRCEVDVEARAVEVDDIAQRRRAAVVE